MADALDLSAEVLYARWMRAVDLLWREAARIHRCRLEEAEAARAARRLKNLQRIVRKAMAEYRRIELERQRRDAGPRES